MILLDVKTLFNRIKSNTGKIEIVLQSLKMGNIKEHSDYYSCSFPDGDNKKACIVYKDSLYVDSYTRDIEDKEGYSTIVSLVMFIKDIYFLNAIKYICEVCGFDYYNRDYKKPRLLSFLDELEEMNTSDKTDDKEGSIKPIDELILQSYRNICNKAFYNDGIDYKTQRLFGLGYDLNSHRITIPIRDEIGNLVGVKGRIFDKDCKDNKYIYLEPCNKNKMLFGLNLTYEHIIKEGIVYVAESEKAVMQGWSCGIKNVVSIGGHHISKEQAKKLTHLGVEICLCFDDKADYVPEKDGEKVKYVKDKEFYRRQKEIFVNGVNITAIIDEKNEILYDKESPFDNLDLWDELLTMKRMIL